MIRPVLLAYMTLLLLGLSDNMRGPLYPEILSEFSLTDSVGSWFFSISSLFGFMGGLASSSVLQKWGELKGLRLSVILMGISLVGLSYAPQFSWLLGFDALFGLSIGIMGVIQNSSVVTHCPLHWRSRVLSGLHSMYALSSLLAPLIVKSLKVESVWRSSFLIAGFFSLIVLLFTLGTERFFARLVRFGFKESVNQVAQTVSIPGTQESKGAQLYFAVMLASYVAGEILPSARIAQYMREVHGYDLSQSATYTAGFFVALLLGRVLFSFWQPRVALKVQLLMFLGLSAACLSFGQWLSPWFFALSGFFMGPFYPLMMVEAGRLFHRTLSQALGYAVAFSSAFVVLMHLLFGWVHDMIGMTAAFSLGPFFCLLSLTMLAGYEKIFRRL